MNILKDDILQEIIHRIVEVAKPERIIMFGFCRLREDRKHKDTKCTKNMKNTSNG